MCLFLTSGFVPQKAANSISDYVSDSSEKSFWYKNPPSRSSDYPLNLFAQSSLVWVNSERIPKAVRSGSAYAKPWQKILKAYMSEKWVATQNADDNASKASEAVTSESFSDRPPYNAGFAINETA